MRFLLRSVVVTVVTALSLMDTSGSNSHLKFAVPLREPSETVQSPLHFVIDKQAGTCHLVLINGLPVNMAFSKEDKFFQIPQVSICVFFKCSKKGVTLSLKKSGCQYGDKCVKKVPDKEGRSYYCLMHLEQVGKVLVNDVPGSPPRPHINYILYNGFLATPSVLYVSAFDKPTKTCTLGEVIHIQGDLVDPSLIPGLDPCAVVRCGKKGLVYDHEESACSVQGEGCQTSYQLACTLFWCVRTVLFSKKKKGKITTEVVNSWMKHSPPTCKAGGECIPLLGVLGETDDPPCSQIACLEGLPGLPQLLPSQTGCLLELLGDLCVPLGGTAGHLVPEGPQGSPENMLDDDTCVEYQCKAVTTDPYRPVVAFLEPAEFGCRDVDLAETLPDNDEPFGCFRKGAITEKNCTRIKCVYMDGQAMIMSKDLVGRCVDETGMCRFPNEEWMTASGEKCFCPLGGGDPICTSDGQ